MALTSVKTLLDSFNDRLWMNLKNPKGVLTLTVIFESCYTSCDDDSNYEE